MLSYAAFGRAEGGISYCYFLSSDVYELKLSMLMSDKSAFGLKM